MPLVLREKKKLAILFILVFFHLILISLQIPLGEEKNFLEKTVFFIFSPVQHGMTVFFKTIGNVWNNYFYLTEVQKANKQMKEEIFLLRHENNQLRKALEELKNNNSIQEYISAIHDSFLIAQVIGIDSRNVYRSIIINKGSLDGLKKNMIVLDKKGNLIGRIISPISLKEAKAQLITDNDSGVGVITQQSRAIGVLTGDGKGNCDLNFIYVTEKVNEGEELLTSGLDHIFSSGIEVGKIISVADDVSLFKKIKVKPNFDFRDLDMIVVIPGYLGDF